jgi:ABC-type branched-subunit amino acid transport system ATPase component
LAWPEKAIRRLNMAAVLETRNLMKHFGALVVANNVSLTVEHGARHALIGPNGAGKTTLVNLLSGALVPNAGRVILEGVDITSEPQYRRVGRGIARTFQVNQLFPNMTPLESVALAVAQRRGATGRWWPRLAGDSEAIGEAAELLDRLRLLNCAHEPTKTLPYGRQRMIEIALALALHPRVLLLDEPAAGVPEEESVELYASLAELPQTVAVLLIEHDMDLVFRFARRITVLVAGSILVEGPPEMISADARVREVYLGEADHG